MRLLIVEDDGRTAGYLRRGLSEGGYVVDHAGDGATGLAMALEGIYDALVVDRLLPGTNGIDLVLALRARALHVPVLMLSAVAGSLDRVSGLRAGCDDYLAKPFSFSELTARIEAIVRRATPTARASILRIADLELDLTRRGITRAGRRIEVQHREFLLLAMLMRHAGQVVTRSMLLEAAWPYDFEPRGNIIDMHIHRLRRKLDDGSAATLIQTVAGAGYRMQAPGSQD